MRMRESSAAALVAVAAVWAVAGGSPAARAGRPMTVKGSMTLDARRLARDVAAAPAVAAVPLAMLDQPSAVQQAGVVPVTTQDFEGEFPPEGWRTFDQRTLAGNQENYTWGNQDLILAPPRAGYPEGGGLKSPWSIGGGRLGAVLAPGSKYDQPMASILSYGPFDATDFDQGVQVNFLTYLDGPIDATDGSLTSFGVCVTTPDPNNTPCRGLIVVRSDGTDLRKQWLGLQQPMKFILAARLPAVRVIFYAQDLNPSGAFVGSFIDNVSIEGLSSSAPTATLVPGQTPQPTDPPRPTSPPEATLPAATPDGRVAFLPLTARIVDKDTMAPSQPTGVPGVVDIGFGTRVLSDGTLIGHANRFGRIDQLCSVQRWSGLRVGTHLAVQWFEGDGKGWKKLILATDNDNLNPSFDVTQDAGGLSQCISYGDDVTPIDAGRYRVAVFLRHETTAWADEVAEVTGEAGPTATPGGPTPIPTAKPTLPANCQDPVINGDFEQQGTGWEGSTKNGHALLRSPGYLSSVAAEMGGYNDAEDNLVNTGQIETLPIADIESVTVRWAVGLDGDEVRGNDDNADRFYIGVVGDGSVDPRAQFLSEDSIVDGALIPLRQWFPLQATVSDLWSKTDGFPTARVFFAVRTNATNPTAFGLDNVSVQYCRKTGGAVSVPVRWSNGGAVDAEIAAAIRSAVPFEAGEVRRSGGSGHAPARPFIATSTR